METESMLKGEMNQCIDDLRLDEMTEKGNDHNCSCDCVDGCSCSCKTTNFEGVEDTDLQEMDEKEEADLNGQEDMHQLENCLMIQDQQNGAGGGVAVGDGVVGHRAKRFLFYCRRTCWRYNCRTRRIWFIRYRVCDTRCRWSCGFFG